MYGLNPVLAPVFAWWLLGDHISWPGAFGIGVALSGVVIIVGPSASAVTDASGLGQLLVMGAAVAVALGSVLLQRVSPVRANLVAYVVPVFAALTGWALLGTAVSAWTAVGFVVVVAGFVIVERDTLIGSCVIVFSTGSQYRRFRGLKHPMRESVAVKSHARPYQAGTVSPPGRAGRTGASTVRGASV